MKTSQLWHPHPETGEWMDIQQIQDSSVRRYYTNGKLVATEQATDLIPTD